MLAIYVSTHKSHILPLSSCLDICMKKSCSNYSVVQRTGVRVLTSKKKRLAVLREKDRHCFIFAFGFKLSIYMCIHKAIVVITGRAHCFHDYIYLYIYICIYIYIYIYIYILRHIYVYT